MVGLEKVYHSPVSQYGGSKPEIVNKTVKNLNAWYISCSTLAMNDSNGYTCFVDQATRIWACRKSKMAAINRK